jgi:HEPN domain-containing protein
MKTYRAEDGFSTADLIQYGCDHLASGRKLFETHPRCFDSAGHLCHLGIELLLKALLLERTSEFPNQHDLVKLLDLIRSRVPGFLLDPAHEETLRRINPFVVLRYPDRKRPLTIGQDDWGPIHALLDAIVDSLPDRMRDEFYNSDPTEKGGRILMSRPKRPDEL